METIAPKKIKVNPRILDYLNSHRDESPILVIDLAETRRSYHKLKEYFAELEIFFAMKANPHPEIIEALINEGSSIDAASIKEIETALKLGCTPEKISFGNIAKRSIDIKKAHEYKIDLYVFDCEEELEKIAKNAPGVKVYYRLHIRAENAILPLDKKFGNDKEMGKRLLMRARELGLRPIGVSFHVGSQQFDTNTWIDALEEIKEIFSDCAKQGLDLKFIDLGGGLPGTMVNQPEIDISLMMETIKKKITEIKPIDQLHVIIEPGRYLVADSGVLQAKVILKTKSHDYPDVNWLFLDCGRYHGLWEVTDDQMLLHVVCPDISGTNKRTIITGPTCDSFDTMYQEAEYYLPDDLSENDRIWFLNCGAYSYSIGTDFNGIEAAKTICLP